MLYWIAVLIGLMIAYKLARSIAHEIADERNAQRIMRNAPLTTQQLRELRKQHRKQRKQRGAIRARGSGEAPGSGG
jgi:hypothetical protein